MVFGSCMAKCEECEGIDVIPIGEDDLYICRHTEKILEKMDETSLKEI